MASGRTIPPAKKRLSKAQWCGTGIQPETSTAPSLRARINKSDIASTHQKQCRLILTRIAEYKK